MSEIGSSLRAARLQHGLELADVERAIRIKARLLEALEEERFELLPGNFYARTFLRSYADFLGLEGEAYAEAYEAGFAEPPPPPLRRRRVWSPRRALAALAVVAAVAALAVLAFAHTLYTIGS